MPIYPFKCLECGKEFDEIHSMKKAPLKVKCKCGQIAYRNWGAYSRTDELMKENIRWSWSLGVDPKRIPEALKIHPGATFNKKGQMRIANRAEKLKRIKEAGFQET